MAPWGPTLAPRAVCHGPEGAPPVNRSTRQSLRQPCACGKGQRSVWAWPRSAPSARSAEPASRLASLRAARTDAAQPPSPPGAGSAGWPGRAGRAPSQNHGPRVHSPAAVLAPGDGGARGRDPHPTRTRLRSPSPLRNRSFGPRGAWGRDAAGHGGTQASRRRRRAPSLPSRSRLTWASLDQIPESASMGVGGPELTLSGTLVGCPLRPCLASSTLTPSLAPDCLEHGWACVEA